MEPFGVIPVFVAVVESGGFSAAARRLGVSKSAVSKRVTQLEDRLGVRLLYRTTRKLSLTEPGEHYYANAVKALAYASEAEDAVTQLQNRPQGRLRINTPMSFGRLHIAPVIPQFMKLYPLIQVEMVMDDQMADLVAGGFDVAIRGGDLPDSSLVARKLAPLNYALCASPDYIERHPELSLPADLAEHNCVLFSYSNHEWAFQSQGKTELVAVSGNYQVNNSEALRDALLQGIGVGRVPSFVVGPDIQSGQLIPLLEDYQLVPRGIYAVYPKRQHLPATVRAFIDFLAEQFGGEVPYWDRQAWSND